MSHTPFYIATVHLLFNAQNQADACDTVSAMLTENLQQQPDCLVSWSYVRQGQEFPEPEEIKVPSDWDDEADWRNNSILANKLAAFPSLLDALISLTELSIDADPIDFARAIREAKLVIDKATIG